MSDQQGVSNPIEDETLAFEYTSGLLRGEERTKFEARLAEDSSLQALVREWDEDLMPLAEVEPMLVPQNDTWSKIDQRLNPKDVTNDPPLRWVWAMFGAMTAVFVLLVFPVAPPLQTNSTPTIGDSSQSNPTVETSAQHVDYVAVMTNDANQPSLTTFGNADSQKLTLHWQIDSTQQAAEEDDFQLWAVSKRDGQVRSIGILEDQNTTALELSNATWRLITDAETLILTREEAGGSAIDEPSDSIIASGVCVRLQRAS